MKKILIFLAMLPLLLNACRTGIPADGGLNEAPLPSNPDMTVKIRSFIPFQDGAKIATNIKAECIINQQLSHFIRVYGTERDIAVIRSKDIDTASKGRVLSVEIVDAISQGNPFLGHRKFTEVAGTLYEDGKEVASFTGARFSGGGFFGAYKGSCSVLGRTVKALGSDIALWLANPVDGQHMGDSI
ncbi:MAG: hypothetical protein RI563_09870 [Thiohalophilus sp.]|uniref:hypothetical protein n=1 Tax=Thiohalophilus sp. TaxID=3028392 RepID=UPI0028702111|nr:hypothetical protein [Thiohalophilus sp.]MDR9437181.1 hypothetical protein [Thiohalophilus sp.]